MNVIEEKRGRFFDIYLPLFTIITAKKRNSTFCSIMTTGVHGKCYNRLRIAMEVYYGTVCCEVGSHSENVF